jgi:hypothetical protein
LREQLTARGATSIRGLGRSFKLFDSYNGNRKVDSQEFFVGLQENGVKITKAEADVSLEEMKTDILFVIKCIIFTVSFLGTDDILRHRW